MLNDKQSNFGVIVAAATTTTPTTASATVVATLTNTATYTIAIDHFQYILYILPVFAGTSVALAAAVLLPTSPTQSSNHRSRAHDEAQPMPQTYLARSGNSWQHSRPVINKPSLVESLMDEGAFVGNIQNPENK